MNYFRFVIVLLFGLISNTAFTQTSLDFKEEFERADNLLLDQRYDDAAELFQRLDSAFPGNANIAFKAGYSILQGRKARVKSVPFLEFAVKNINPKYKDQNASETGAPALSWYFLSQAYHLDYRFDEAIAAIDSFKLSMSNIDSELSKDLDRRVQVAEYGKILVSSPVKIEIENLGSSINTIYPEYAPVISADEEMIIFTSRRPSEKGKLDESGQYYEDIYISFKDGDRWKSPVNIGKPITTLGHEATVGLSVDGQKLFIYKSTRKDGGDLYSSNLIGDQWTEPVSLGKNINSKSWEPSVSISADGKMLYFTSDREGGFGGTDIYMSRVLPNGDWSLPVNMGPAINTEFDEDAPFIHPDGKTLFFSSKGHMGMGGFDVFFSSKNDEGQWEKPFNVGYPLNSTDDDIFYVLSADGKRAYYSSFQQGGFGEKDIYMATFVDNKEKPLALVTGYVRGYYGGVPENIEIVVTNNETGELVGIYYPNTKSGKYLFILPPGPNYNIRYEASNHLFHSENLNIPDTANYYEIQKSIDLSPLTVGSKIVLNNIFFETNKAVVTNSSNVEIEKIRHLLEISPGVKVEISGHTDSRGPDEYNQDLSERRAQAVVDKLLAVGVDESRIVAKGYGETMLIAKETNPDGSDNPEGRAANRRVELKVLASD